MVKEELTEEVKEKGESTVRCAYVVFKSLKDRQRFLKLTGEGESLLTEALGCFSLESQEDGSFEFLETMIKVKKAGPPQEIKWENISYSSFQRRVRRWGFTGVVMVLLLVAVFGLVEMEYLSNSYEKKFASKLVCPQKFDKAMAWIDHQRPEDARVGLMHCFCSQKEKTDPNYM